MRQCLLPNGTKRGIKRLRLSKNPVGRKFGPNFDKVGRFLSLSSGHTTLKLIRLFHNSQI